MSKDVCRFDSKRFRNHYWFMFSLICLGFGLSGCTSVLSPIRAIPANRIPPQFLAEPQANKRPIDASLLRTIAPKAYTLDKDDVLGVFIEGVLGKENEAPPVTFPEPDSDLSPGIGFPIPVRADGTISLPLIDPIAVRGLTVPQVEALVKRRYGEADILVNPRVIVTQLKKRTYRVFVVRQDNTNLNAPQVSNQRAVSNRSDQSSRGFVLNLPAGENDLLNALSQTGGLPGVNAKPEVTILRGDAASTEERLQQMRANGNTPFDHPLTVNSRDSITIPMRLRPNEVPNFRAEDVVLRDGDVVYVESRDTDIYYTTGLLGGGEWTLPRDYDLDVLGAVSLAGQSVGAGGQNGRGLIGGGVNTLPPTELVVLRKLPGNRQIAIAVDLSQAVNDPRSRLLVAPGDTLLLRYKPQEEALNFAISTFFTFGIRELFR